MPHCLLVVSVALCTFWWCHWTMLHNHGHCYRSLSVVASATNVALASLKIPAVTTQVSFSCQCIFSGSHLLYLRLGNYLQRQLYHMKSFCKLKASLRYEFFLIGYPWEEKTYGHVQAKHFQVKCHIATQHNYCCVGLINWHFIACYQLICKYAETLKIFTICN